MAVCGLSNAVTGVCTYISAHWEMLVAFLMLSGGALRYLDLRRRELSWKRTEFLFEQAKYFDSDADIARAVALLAGTDPSGMSIDQVFGLQANPKEPVIAKYRTSFDKLLNLLDWFAYATFDAKSVRLDEVANFGWYLRKIREDPTLYDYCWDNGFRDTLRLANEVSEYNRRREKRLRRRKVDYSPR